MKTALMILRSRVINTLVGCAIGLAFIAIGGARLITLPLAMAVTVLVSSYFVRIQTMWRQAPISCAFVIAAGFEHHSRINGLKAGAQRMAEVIFGCVVGLAVAWLVSVVWPLPDPPALPPLFRPLPALPRRSNSSRLSLDVLELQESCWRISLPAFILGVLLASHRKPSIACPSPDASRVWRIRLLMFLAVIGPGFITANVDNDAGGIYTYSAAGAQFGYLLLWTIIPMTLALIVVQEMSARMGAVTGKGLSDLIREEYGFAHHVLHDAGTGDHQLRQRGGGIRRIASSLELFHISRYISVPARGAGRVAAGGEGHVQERRKGFPGGLVLLLRLHHRRRAGRAELEGGLRCDLQAAADQRFSRLVRTSTWSSASWERPSLRGCSSICSRRSWRRELRRANTGHRAGT